MTFFFFFFFLRMHFAATALQRSRGLVQMSTPYLYVLQERAKGIQAIKPC
jgi:hypothetical protein